MPGTGKALACLPLVLTIILGGWLSLEVSWAGRGHTIAVLLFTFRKNVSGNNPSATFLRSNIWYYFRMTPVIVPDDHPSRTTFLYAGLPTVRMDTSFANHWRQKALKVQSTGGLKLLHLKRDVESMKRHFDLELDQIDPIDFQERLERELLEYHMVNDPFITFFHDLTPSPGRYADRSVGVGLPNGTS